MNAKATLMRQLDTSDVGALEAEQEVERVRAVVDRAAAYGKLRPEDLRASQKDRENMERSVSNTATQTVSCW